VRAREEKILSAPHPATKADMRASIALVLVIAATVAACQKLYFDDKPANSKLGAPDAAPYPPNDAWPTDSHPYDADNMDSGCGGSGADGGGSGSGGYPDAGSGWYPDAGSGWYPDAGSGWYPDAGPGSGSGSGGSGSGGPCCNTPDAL
jgi:hypothetical protein